MVDLIPPLSSIKGWADHYTIALNAKIEWLKKYNHNEHQTSQRTKTNEIMKQCPLWWFSMKASDGQANFSQKSILVPYPFFLLMW